ncbi:bifunctional phosphopantothenoylcysteine decarboxylase/phosphopantothenate--cysteine ligase CoaBC [Actinomycetospora callitridis]|uniref:bifunctional phosphopantothenoylcysteine decarboxylase/phosphopantothenate--cysteine ligase CoaBC n=1 Tax=Actinomycetospora callitridis TaxID=913944 RepID=UPI002366EAC4|nr:bifunctional phosphopantothenoylcysteine decarboxylase/phosphopantothenate--cysteine ligase CoaBC [Actinomycetospora callitridis]MDD7918541.1 bifunctional phosphopantothenoylcysteine decarboxylase/phosphopantothenate--cysteine ligase CoaBC [Actinomycetospora callitridis]
MTEESTRPREIVLGVSGGIAAYKSCEVLRRLREAGNHVQVVATRSALEFIGAATFEALSGRPVLTGVFENVPEVEHVALGRRADLVVLVPATADLLARMAQGRADDMLTTTLLTARCPVLAVPAMHTEMWEHPATVDNVATLRRRGTVVLEPASGRLTGADTGRGRLPEPPEIAEFARLLLEWGIDDGGMPFPLPRDLEGRRVVVSAGGTAEPLDPVRTLGNRSSGRQGYALARVAAQRGADVTLVAGTVADLDPPAGVELRRVQTTREMRDAVLDAAKAADVVVMAAAVSDFRPASTSVGKIKKGQDAPSIPLEFNPDILRELVTEDVPRRLVVGFAAETGDDGGSVLDYGRAKLERKGCDLLVVNAVGAGRAFEVEDNEGWLLGADGSSLSLPMGSKAALAARVWDAVAERLP